MWEFFGWAREKKKTSAAEVFEKGKKKSGQWMYTAQHSLEIRCRHWLPSKIMGFFLSYSLGKFMAQRERQWLMNMENSSREERKTYEESWKYKLKLPLIISFLLASLEILDNWKKANENFRILGRTFTSKLTQT